MYKRIVIFVESAFSQRDFHRYGVQIFLDNGFEVELYDVTRILKPHVQSHVSDVQNFQGARLTVCNTRQDVEKGIQNLGSDSFAVLHITFCRKSLFIFSALTAHQTAYATVTGSLLPGVRRSFFYYLKRMASLSLGDVLEKIANRAFTSQFKTIAAPYAVISGGRIFSKKAILAGDATHIIPGHSPDYDLFLNTRTDPVAVEGDYAVFLDEYLPYHPDYEHLKIAPFSTPEEYYPVLNAFFDRIENEHGLQVIMAAHPRSRYDLYPGSFGPRQMIYGRTASIVKDARFVILHSSTSVNFAILHHKPLLFTTTEAIDRTYYGSAIRHMASFLGLSPLNLNAQASMDCCSMPVDLDLYHKYIANYIKMPGTPDIPLWQIFCNYIQQIL